MSDLLLRAARGEAVQRPPVWMMRQAGRYLPEYRALRAKHDFLTLIKTPALAAEVTLQPLDAVGVDAAIIFSDILVIPEAMGLTLTVEEGVGPRLHEPLRAPADFDRLREIEPAESLGYVLDALRLTRERLAGRAPLIGFAGGPWTLACYMIEGGGSKHFARAKRLLVEDPGRAHGLLARLADNVGRLLKAQVEAGAQVVQIFDSWGGALGPSDFRTFALPPLAEAVRIAREAGAPVIAFVPGAGWALEEIARATRADVIGVDWQTDPGDARRRLAPLGVATQGNLDPCWLYAAEAEIRRRTHVMLAAFGPRGHIANLGHGIQPDVPVSHARAFVDAVKSWDGGEPVAG